MRRHAIPDKPVDRDEEHRPRWSVPAVVGTYLVAGLGWIGLTTPIAGNVAELFGVARSTVELSKGVGFVLVTGAILYASMRHWEIAYREATDRGRRDLERREQRFRNLAEQTQGAVYRFRLTPEPEVEYVSPQFEELTGYGRADLERDPHLLVDRIHPEDRPRLHFSTTCASDVEPDEPAVATFRFHRADGEWTWIEDHRSVELDSEGRVEARQGIAFDVAARRQEEDARDAAMALEHEAAEHLRRMVQAHQTFLSGISHELRTPLTGVVGFAQTLQARNGDMGVRERARLLERLTANTQRLARLLDDLLDLDRLSRGVLELHPSPDVDLAALSAALVEELEAPHHRIRLQVPPTSLLLDRQKVERIIDNLLRNAVKHTPDGTTVRLWAEQRADDVLIVVEDDGPGLDDDAEQLFEPFRQGRAAGSRASPGTGVGLALVREFATIHGGEAWHESREPHGSRFSVRLPHRGAERPVTDARG